MGEGTRAPRYALRSGDRYSGEQGRRASYPSPDNKDGSRNLRQN